MSGADLRDVAFRIVGVRLPRDRGDEDAMDDAYSLAARRYVLAAVVLVAIVLVLEVARLA